MSFICSLFAVKSFLTTSCWLSVLCCLAGVSSSSYNGAMPYPILLTGGVCCQGWVVLEAHKARDPGQCGSSRKVIRLDLTFCYSLPMKISSFM